MKNTEWFLRKARLVYEIYDYYRDRLAEGLKYYKLYTDQLGKTRAFLQELIDKQVKL